MTILCRILLVICPGLLGLVAGTWLGGHYLVPKGSGLAGGPMALGYGLGGAALLACLGGAAAYSLEGASLRRGAMACALAAAATLGALGLRMMAKDAAQREPDAAFAPAGRFTATMERLDQSDPYLFVKMEVDSQRRTWTQVGPAPKSQTCSSTMKAAHLVEIRKALDGLAAARDKATAACGATSGPALKRLRWSLEGKEDSLEVSAACAQALPEVARALALVESASRAPASKVTCR